MQMLQRTLGKLRDGHDWAVIEQVLSNLAKQWKYPDISTETICTCSPFLSRLWEQNSVPPGLFLRTLKLLFFCLTSERMENKIWSL